MGRVKNSRNYYCSFNQIKEIKFNTAKYNQIKQTQNNQTDSI